MPALALGLLVPAPLGDAHRLLGEFAGEGPVAHPVVGLADVEEDARDDLALLVVGDRLVGAQEVVEGLLDLAELEADLADVVEGRRLAQAVALPARLLEAAREVVHRPLVAPHVHVGDAERVERFHDAQVVGQRP